MDLKKLYSKGFEQDLDILTDLSPKDVQAMDEISQTGVSHAHPSTRTHLKNDGLIADNGGPYVLTPHGKAVFQRALWMLDGQMDFLPGPFLDDDTLRILRSKAPISVASRIRKYLFENVENSAVKLAIFLGRYPYAYRHLSRLFGFWDIDCDLVQVISERGHPDRYVRGDLIGLSEKGIDLLNRVKYRL